MNSIKCQAVNVKTGDGICPGMAKTQKGEVYTLGPRTPESSICSTAFTSIQPWSLSMMLTDKMDWERKDHFDVVCPHGMVTFRLSRIRE
jgi:uncharacterized repeat protein (TIGR04076 family)